MIRTAPPATGDEATQLRAYLDYQRDTLREKITGLDAAQLAATHPPSEMTLGGMLKHLAYVEDNWFSVVLLGRSYAEPWASVDWAADADWEWHSAGDQTPEELRELFDSFVVASDVALDIALAETEEGGVERLTALDVRGYDGPVNVRWILLHMIEEYARHNGHADLLRESIDGSTGA